MKGNSDSISKPNTFLYGYHHALKSFHSNTPIKLVIILSAMMGKLGITIFLLLYKN